ncbi:MAG: glycosyltransferase family 39 protein [Vicinamibacterales bacterium]
MPSHSRLLVLVIAVSTVLRLGAAVYHGPAIEDRPGVTDEVSYHTLAVRVLDGHGFTFGTNWWPATRANEPTAHWSFLYVLFLAGVYAVTGPLPLVARVLQAVIVGVLHPWLAWRIGDRLFGPTAGLATAAATAVYGYFVYYSGALVTESLYIVAVLWMLDVATALAFRSSPSMRAESMRPWLLLGLAAATATLLRQLFLLMVPVVLAWTAWQLLTRRGGDAPVLAVPAVALRVVVALAVVGAAMLPWTARNYRAFGQLVPLNTNAGYVMFWGNHPVHGTSFVPIMSTGSVNYLTLLPRELKGLDEAALDRELLRRGVGFVTDDPVRYVRLSMSRAVEYFKFWPTPESGFASNALRLLSFGLLLPFLVSGIAIAFVHGGDAPERKPGAVLLLLVAALYTLIHLLTWTLVRYRLPVDAMTMPFAGMALAAAVARLGRASDPLRVHPRFGSPS